MSVIDALQSLRPGAAWTIKNEDYKQLNWLDKVQTKPTEQEVLDEIARLEAYEGTDDDRMDKAFTLDDKDRVLFEAIFELANDVRELKGQQPITRAQLRDWLKAKLP